MGAEPPEFPAGPYTEMAAITDVMRQHWITELRGQPAELRRAVEGLTETQLDIKYRNWSIRQIVHHIADSHVNSYVRFKWTLTEDTPLIKAYDEGLWSNLAECCIGPVAPSLLLLEGLHARWCQLLSTLTSVDFERSFVHPESGATISLNRALSYYAWHGKHHTGQILWLLSRG